MKEFFAPEFGNELKIRIEKVRERMESAGIDACLIASNTNLYYLSGRIYRGYVFLPLVGQPIYFVIRPIGLEGENVVYIRKPEQIVDELSKRGIGNIRKIGLEYDWLTYSDAMRLERCVEKEETVNVSSLLKTVRMVKTEYEIAKMKEDGIRQSESYSRISSVYRKEMTDIEFQIEIEKILRLEGSLGFYRTSGNLMEINSGSVLNGENADMPTPYDFAVGGGGADLSLPVGAAGKIMHRGTTVMIDMNGNFNGYQTDMTRVWRIGEISEFAQKAHEVSRKILRELEKMAVPGTAVSKLYEVAVKIAEENELADYFMGHSQKAAFIGHGVGIELNELPVLTPRSKDVLAEGMTLAIEPKFVIPQVGGVGVENTYVVRKEGLEKITLYPEEIGEL